MPYTRTLILVVLLTSCHMPRSYLDLVLFVLRAVALVGLIAERFLCVKISDILCTIFMFFPVFLKPLY